MDNMLYIFAGLAIILLIVALVMRKNKAQRPSVGVNKTPEVNKARVAPVVNRTSSNRENLTDSSNVTKFDNVTVAQRFIDQQRYDRAIETLQRGLEEKPHDGALLLKLLNVYLITDQLNEFISTYNTIQDSGDQEAIKQAQDLKNSINDQQTPRSETYTFATDTNSSDQSSNIASETTIDGNAHNVQVDSSDAFTLTLDDLEATDSPSNLSNSFDTVLSTDEDNSFTNSTVDDDIDSVATSVQPSVAETTTDPTDDFDFNFDLSAEDSSTQADLTSERPVGNDLTAESLGADSFNDNSFSDNISGDNSFDEIESELDFSDEFDFVIDDPTTETTDSVDNTLSNTDGLNDNALNIDDLDFSSPENVEQQQVEDFSLSLEDSVLEGGALANNDLQNSVLEDSASKDNALEDIALEDSVLEDTGLQDYDISDTVTDNSDDMDIEASNLLNSSSESDFGIDNGVTTVSQPDTMNLVEDADEEAFDFSVVEETAVNPTEVVADSTSPTFDDSLSMEDDFVFEDVAAATEVTSFTPVVTDSIVADDTITSDDTVTSNDTIAADEGVTAVDIDSQFATDFDFIKTLDSNQITLDLAGQYLQLGEYDSAKRLLQEVIAKGNSEQQQQAQALLPRTA